MGRPLNKRYFGVNSAANLKVQFFNGTASVPGYIVKQRGSKTFVCSDAAGNTAICRLVADIAADALTEGQMSITVKLDNGTITQISKISGHKITVDGASLPWSFSTSTADGAVQVEEAGTGIGAGTDTVLGTADDVLTDSTNLEGDAE